MIESMGERIQFQPLTREDRISVVLYRAGIAISALLVTLGGYMLLNAAHYRNDPLIGLKFTVLLLSLYISVGMSVFFIHLYVSKFHRVLKKLYYIALAGLGLLFFIGGGNIYAVFAAKPYASLALLPLSGCLGFITAKEAFCFKLIEGYLLAFLMPLFLVYTALTGGVPYGTLVIGLLLLLFTVRKVFQPLHFDIGDKSAYM
ncbi:MAG: DUF2301 domain-containing membrane protein [Alphaproteobacteria bacterium]|uniref:DUF2301 domain-containing membrane protein n=1 Tax=Candidatus Nitrobium versatile TaxID=2884831 RepID=A0A953M1P8_9BACT|nr:DUF2301 domain-containing membrane protein [Candidatus Nitrobium versatile]